MPYILVQLVSCKEGISLSDFRTEYETGFVPLLYDVCGPLAPTRYIRRYIARNANDEQRKDGPMGLPALLIGHDEEVGWDAMAEMTFQDELHFQQFFAHINEEGPAERLLVGERKFSDIHKLKFIVMEGYEDGKDTDLKSLKKE